jgi:P27 family predicted phage terminase small subunit
MRPPKGIGGPAGAAIWRSVQRSLRDSDQWDDNFAPLLERYVLALLRWTKYRALADAEPTTRGSMGQLVQHPYVKTAREAEHDAHRYAQALLLTPEARKKLARAAEADDGGGELGF